MKYKLNCILLVDDDSATNFIHHLILKKTGCTEAITAVENGLKALEYLQTTEDGKYPQPDLILLDINMPVMNGWEFLERYTKIEPAQRGSKLILMISSALSPSESEKAKSNSLVDGIMYKPLTTQLAKELLEQHFKKDL